MEDGQNISSSQVASEKQHEKSNKSNNLVKGGV